MSIEGLRARQRLALALDKSGKVDEANQLLEALLAEGNLDAETGSLLAGRYKQQGLSHGDRAKLVQAHQVYRATYDRTQDPFAGINVAALGLHLDPDGGRVTAALLAQEVATSIERSMQEAPSDVDHWRVATLAEAQLLQGKLEDARETYVQAAERARDRPQDVAVMRRQARLNLRNLHKDPSALDDALPVPGAAGFTGHLTDVPGRRPPRFPERKVPDVARALRAVLAKRNIQYGVCSAARGSDLTFLAELLARGGSARVVLPFPVESFKKTSVGQGWDERFDELLGSSNVELLVQRTDTPAESEQPAAFAACNRAILNEVLLLAQRFDQAPLLIAVSNASSGAEGGTGDFLTQWRSETDRELEIVPPFGAQ